MSEILMFTGKILVSFTCLYYIFIVIFCIIGLFIKKRPPVPYFETGGELRTAVLICARNEENVIGNLIDSLKEQNYPKDKIRIFVVAHNCTDSTKQTALEHGALVYERNEPKDTCKGQALNWGIKQIQNDYPNYFESMVFFDADNIAGRNFIYEINKALEKGADIAQGYRASKNHNTNLITKLFAIFWIYVIRFNLMPIAKAGLGGMVSGTGFAVKISALSEESWLTYTLLEDVEFSVQHIIKGHIIDIADSAVFYDEQPTKLSDALNQRYRWSVGRTQLLKRYFLPTLKYTFRHFFIGIRLLFDVCCNLFLFEGIIGEALIITSMILSPMTISEVLLSLSVSLLRSCILLMLPIICTMLCERIPLKKNIGTILLFPAYMALFFVFGFISFFNTDIKWKPIPHEDTTRLDRLEGDITSPHH